MSDKILKSVILLLICAIIISIAGIGVLIVTKHNSQTADEPISNNTNNDSNNTDDGDNGDEITYLINIEKYEKYIEPNNKNEYLVLVNKDNDYGTTVPDNIVDAALTNGYDFSSYDINYTALMALEAMCLEAQKSGISGIDITSAYRSYQKQVSLFYSYCDKEKAKNPSLSQSEAEAIVEKYFCRPGTSEHQTGLAVDLYDKGDSATLLEESFADTAAGKWLSENSYKFGFILRFPKDKSDVTGIVFEPWHFRFVGRSAAVEMRDLGMCLEEYIDYLGKQSSSN